MEYLVGYAVVMIVVSLLAISVEVWKIRTGLEADREEAKSRRQFRDIAIRRSTEL